MSLWEELRQKLLEALPSMLVGMIAYSLAYFLAGLVFDTSLPRSVCAVVGYGVGAIGTVIWETR